jgi:integrase
MEGAGIYLRFHDLRHANATLSMTAGVDLKATSFRLGHSRIGIRADTYVGMPDDHDRAAATKLDALLAPVMTCVSNP